MKKAEAETAERTREWAKAKAREKVEIIRIASKDR